MPCYVEILLSFVACAFPFVFSFGCQRVGHGSFEETLLGIGFVLALSVPRSQRYERQRTAIIVLEAGATIAPDACKARP